MLITAVRLGKRLAICSLSAGTLLLASGCARAHPHTVAVIPEMTAQELWEAEHAGVASAALGTNWEIYWNGPGRKDDVARQIELVEAAIAQLETGLQSYTSAEETRRQMELLAESRARLAEVLAEWERVSAQLEEAR